MNTLSHFIPVLASTYGGGDLAIVLIAEMLTGLCVLIGVPCVMWKKHLAVRILMRLCGVGCLLAALLVLSAIDLDKDWVFLTFPLVLGPTLFILARRKPKIPSVSE